MSHQLGYSASNLDPVRRRCLSRLTVQTVLHSIVVRYSSSSPASSHLDLDDFEINTTKTAAQLVGTPESSSTTGPATLSGSPGFSAAEPTTVVQTVPGSASSLTHSFASLLSLALVAVVALF